MKPSAKAGGFAVTEPAKPLNEGIAIPNPPPLMRGTKRNPAGREFHEVMSMAGKGKPGRPAWEPDEETLEAIRQMASTGLTREQIADALGISTTTLRARQAENPAVSEALKKGTAQGIAAVANALWSKALGGDVAAAIFYLKTRAGWRDSNADEIRRAELELKRQEMERKAAAEGSGDDGPPAVMMVPPDSDDWQKLATHGDSTDG